LFYFANNLYTLLALPLLKHLPVGQGLIATNVVSPFFAPVELTFVASLFLAVPIILYQVWAFIAPALYQHERRLIWPLLFISVILFYVGVAFAYFVIFPLLFAFLTQTAPHGVLVSPDISQYLDFTLKLLFIFGSIFEVPVATILLILTGVTTRETLVKYRSYAIVAAFVIGMLLAPPDILSQTLLAIPLWLLFEMGIWLSRFFKR
jgi:sec-independent protein translocase protein TatC